MTYKEYVVALINEKYTEAKREKNPYTAPELLPQEIISDQVKVVIDTLMNEIVDLNSQIININLDLENLKKAVSILMMK